MAVSLPPHSQVVPQQLEDVPDINTVSSEGSAGGSRVGMFTVESSAIECSSGYRRPMPGYSSYKLAADRLR